MPRSTRCRPLIQARVCVCVSVCTSFALPNFLISSNRLVGSLWFCGQTTPSFATHEKQKTPTPFQDVCLLSLSSCLMALAIPSGTMLGHHSCDGVQSPLTHEVGSTRTALADLHRGPIKSHPIDCVFFLLLSHYFALSASLDILITSHSQNSWKEILLAFSTPPKIL